MPKKVSGKSVDGAQQNFEQVVDFLSQLFPSCVIEKSVDSSDASQSDGGQPQYARDIDWQALGNMIGKTLSCEENESLRREPFGFYWAGKNEAAREAIRPISMALRPCLKDSEDWDHTRAVKSSQKPICSMRRLGLAWCPAKQVQDVITRAGAL